MTDASKQHLDEYSHAVSGAVHTFKHGASFVCLDADGQMGPLVEASGLFGGDTQMVSDWRVQVDRDLRLVQSEVSAERTALRLLFENDRVRVERHLTLHDGRLLEQVSVTNLSDKPLSVPVAFRFGSHFHDIFRVRGDTTVKSGPISAETRGSVHLDHKGVDGNLRQSSFHFSAMPTTIGSRNAETHEADFTLNLKPGATSKLVLAGGKPLPDGFVPTPAFFKAALKSARDDFRSLYRNGAWVESNDPAYNELLETSQKDLAVLLTRLETGLYPYAGLPWYATTFGRDGVITALQLLPFKPEIAKGVLSMLGKHQATEFNKQKESEPGKVFHEMRAGESSLSGQNYFDCYYGGVDTTPLYVMLAGEYYKRTNDLDFIRSQWDRLEKAVDWIINYGDLDGDGLIEHVVPLDRKGLTVQSWMDSGDSMFHANGILPKGPLAICDVQGDAYAAFRQAAAMATALGLPDKAAYYSERAEITKKAFNDKFWSDELGTYVRALDGFGDAKTPCMIRGSNPGQLLYTGIVPEDRAASVVRTLMAPDSFSGFGIRTLSEGQKRYNPLGYHNGTVWPHDNSLIAAGMARYGFKSEALQLMKSQFDAASGFKDRRIPELFSGAARQPGKAPEIYPAACSPQAWAAASSLLFLQMALEMRIDPATARVYVDALSLPGYMGNLTIRNLPVGNGHCAVRIRNTESGKPKVSVTPTPPR
ncbi:MAG: glycogen debranching N-terminal domain-containing protein [Micavibrio sp.]